MKNSEKVILAIGALVIYILYFRYKKQNSCPECPVCPKQPIVRPMANLNVSIPVQSSPIVNNPLELEEVLIYTGPDKFEMKSKTDVNISYLYFVKDGKYYKSEYNKINATEPSKTSEITIKEIVDAWNSVK